MHTLYLSTISLIERLHRQFLEVVKAELEALHIDDINNVQALMLANIGKDQLTVGELTHRGYYLGSNVSYNVKKLVENDYLAQEPSPHDKRSIRIRLSDKGLELCDKINEMFGRQAEKLRVAGTEDEDLKELMNTLRELELFWTDQLNQAGLIPYEFK